MFRNLLERAVGIGAAARVFCMPWLLLIARVWFGQIVFVHQIMAMAERPEAGSSVGSVLHVPSALDAALHGLGPLLLTLGLLTRPIALVLLAGGISAGPEILGFNPEGAKFALLAWLVVLGAGPLSLDTLLRRGLSWVPFSPIRFLQRGYVWIERYLSPLLLIAVRVGIAISLAAFALPATPWIRDAIHGSPATSFVHPAWLAAALAGAIALGCMTRLCVLVYAAMIPIAGIAMSMDDRFAILLLLLVLAATGPGSFSIDQLIARWANTGMARKAAAPDSLPHIVVVGGGFGGVAAVRGLRKERCRITLIDQRNHHLFQPLLYQVATAALSPTEIATPIRSLFRGQQNVQVRLGKVTGINTVAREVELGVARVKFDYLVLATGAQHSYFGKDDWAPFAPGLKSIEDATAMRSRLLRAFEEAENATDEADRLAWLTFVIVGGGPTGIELAGAIAELAHHGMEQEYRSIDPSTARVILLQAGGRVLPTFPAMLSAAAERSLRGLGVEVCLDTRVLGVDSSGVDLGARRIAARTTLWAAGVAASPAAQWVAQPSDRSGRLTVGDDLSVPTLPGIYAIGDTVSSLGWRGEPVPGLAPAAKQQGTHVARVIAAHFSGRQPPPPFRYRHFGSLATIGRQAAVAEIGGIRVWGAFAWWFWGAAHIAFLVGGRNRITVMLDWIWAYLTYRRSTRLITGPTLDRSLD